MAKRAALPRPQRGSQSTGVWELLGPPFPLSHPLQIPSEVASGICLSLCSALCRAQPPACPQFSLPSVLMFKRGCVGGGYECLVTGRESASVSTAHSHVPWRLGDGRGSGS